MSDLIYFVPDCRPKSEEYINKQAKKNSLEKSHLSPIITQKGTLCGLEKDYTSSKGGSSFSKTEVNN